MDEREPTPLRTGVVKVGPRTDESGENLWPVYDEGDPSYWLCACERQTDADHLARALEGVPRGKHSLTVSVNGMMISATGDDLRELEEALLRGQEREAVRRAEYSSYLLLVNGIEVVAFGNDSDDLEAFMRGIDHEGATEWTVEKVVATDQAP